MNTNLWNRWRYTLYAPLYDWIVRPFNSSRQRSIELLDLKAGEHVLVLGAGTGEDIRFISKGIDITAIDITPAMVEQIRQKADQLQRPVKAEVMDGQALTFPNNSFDAVVLHLILAVIPDPVACIQEATRVLKAEGHIVVFDKFLPETQKSTVLRRLANVVTSFLFSDINRRLEPIAATVPLEKVREESSAYARLGYKITLYRKS